MATPPHVTTPPSRRHIGRMGSSQDEIPNLQIIKEGAELEVAETKPRSATLPPDAKLSLFDKEEREGEEGMDGGGEGQTARGSKEEGKKNEDDDRVFTSQGKIGQHKFYSFTR